MYVSEIYLKLYLAYTEKSKCIWPILVFKKSAKIIHKKYCIDVLAV